MFIVAYSTGTAKDLNNDTLKDHWETHEDRWDAEAAYEALLERDDVFTASWAEVRGSTDY